MLIPFKKTEDVLLATVVWYMVFYSPGDVVTWLAKKQPFALFLGCMKEVRSSPDSVFRPEYEERRLELKRPFHRC